MLQKPKLSIAQCKMIQACYFRKPITLIKQILFSTLLLQFKGTLKHYKTEDATLVKEKEKDTGTKCGISECF